MLQKRGTTKYVTNLPCFPNIFYLMVRASRRRREIVYSAWLPSQKPLIDMLGPTMACAPLVHLSGMQLQIRQNINYLNHLNLIQLTD